MQQQAEGIQNHENANVHRYQRELNTEMDLQTDHQSESDLDLNLLTLALKMEVVSFSDIVVYI